MTATDRNRALGRFALRLSCALLIFVSFCGGIVMFGLERHIIYLPSREVEQTPAAYQLRSEDIVARTADGETIRGFYIHKTATGNAARSTLLLSHGNAGSVANRLHRAALFHDRLDVDVALYDYRGYGHSSGKPTEPGTYQDAHAVFDWLVGRGVPASHIVLFGESLGCAVSVQLALDRPAAGLVLEAPFSSIRAMAKRVLPWLPVGPFLRTRYDNQAKIGRVAAPILIIHGTDDEVIPYSHGESLFSAAREPKRFLPVPGAHHNDVYVVGGQRYLDTLAAFLRAEPGPPAR